MIYVGSSSNSYGCQWKGGKVKTNEERKEQKGLEGTVLTLFSDQVYGAAHASYPTHEDVAKMVVEVECRINQEVNCADKGQSEEKKVAQLEGGWSPNATHSEKNDGRWSNAAHSENNDGRWSPNAAQSEKNDGRYVQQSPQKIYNEGGAVGNKLYESYVGVSEVGGSVESQKVSYEKETNLRGDQGIRNGAESNMWEDNGLLTLCTTYGASEEDVDVG